MSETVFIASTINGLAVAEKIQSILSTDYKYRLCPAKTFVSGESALESLLNETVNVNFSVFILTAEDKLANSELGKDKFVPRDNLVFEMGLFLSALGRNRVAICAENPPGLKMPSDLDGQNTIDFTIPRDTHSHEFQLIIDGVANKIESQFSKCDCLEEETLASAHRNRIGGEPLGFGDSRLTDIVVDSAFQPTDRIGLGVEIQQAINSKRTFPTKLFYVTEEGANAWLKLTRDSEYKFFSSSISFLRKHSGTIVDVVSKNITGKSPDLISLGSGDGEKDAILMNELTKKFYQSETESKVSYFPIDFSFYLITETVKNVSSNLTNGSYRIKPIVGDMVDLPSFRYVYDHYSNPNLFVILGNTIGNNDEKSILDAIREAILPGDMVLVEVNTNIADIKKSNKNDFIVSQKNLKHIFAPLSVLGLDYDEKSFFSKTSNNLSSCPNTISIETYYKSDDFGSIRVSINHRYDFKQFCSWISETLGCETIWQHEEENVGVVLLVKSNTVR